jgi:hypothetical protein
LPAGPDPPAPTLRPRRHRRKPAPLTK